MRPPATSTAGVPPDQRGPSPRLTGAVGPQQNRRPSAWAQVVEGARRSRSASRQWRRRPRSARCGRRRRRRPSETATAVVAQHHRRPPSVRPPVASGGGPPALDVGPGATTSRSLHGAPDDVGVGPAVAEPPQTGSRCQSGPGRCGHRWPPGDLHPRPAAVPPSTGRRPRSVLVPLSPTAGRRRPSCRRTGARRPPCHHVAVGCAHLGGGTVRPRCPAAAPPGCAGRGRQPAPPHRGEHQPGRRPRPSTSAVPPAHPSPPIVGDRGYSSAAGAAGRVPCYEHDPTDHRGRSAAPRAGKAHRPPRPRGAGMGPGVRPQLPPLLPDDRRGGPPSAPTPTRRGRTAPRGHGPRCASFRLACRDPAAARSARRELVAVEEGGTASVKTSLRSPATMCPAPGTIDELDRREAAEEVVGLLLADQVAHAAPDEQHGRRRPCARRRRGGGRRP